MTKHELKAYQTPMDQGGVAGGPAKVEKGNLCPEKATGVPVDSSLRPPGRVHVRGEGEAVLHGGTAQSLGGQHQASVAAVRSQGQRISGGDTCS